MYLSRDLSFWSSTSVFLSSWKKIILVTFLVLAAPVWAMDLQQAKAQGIVGEQTNGYLGAVVDSAEARRIVSEVNAKRKTLYMKLAKKNKVDLIAVEVLAGKKAIEKTASGHYIQNSAGKWVKK